VSPNETDRSTRRQVLRRAAAAGSIATAAALTAPAVGSADVPAANYAVLGADEMVGGPGGSPISAAIVQSDLASGLPEPAAGQSGRLLVESGRVAVVSEALNACQAGYLTQGSQDDQHAGLQGFLNAIGHAVGGRGGRGVIPGGLYHMGNGQVSFPTGIPCEVEGEGGPIGYGIMDFGTVLQWDSDVPGPPHQTYAITIGKGGARQRLRKMTLNGPSIRAGQAGGLMCALGGVHAVSGSTLEELYLRNFSSGVGWGGAGLSYDHSSSFRVIADACGYGYHLLPGSGGGGDFHHERLWLSCTLAAVATAQSASSGLGGSNWISSSFAGCPFGIYRYADGSKLEADFIDATGFYGCSFEGNAHAVAYDELWQDGKYGGNIANSLFTWGAGYNSPGNYSNTLWSKRFSVTQASGKQITVRDGSGFVFRPGMAVTGHGFAAGTTVTAVTGTWPWASATLTLSHAPAGGASSCTVAQPQIAALVARTILNNDFLNVWPQTNGHPALAAIGITNNRYTDGSGALDTAVKTPLIHATQSAANNVWGRGDSGLALGSAATTDKVACGDLVMKRAGYGGGVVRCDGSRKPLGAAIRAADGHAGVAACDYVIRACVDDSHGAIVRNRSGSAITPGALLKVDAAHPGGVMTASSLADGPAIGVNGPGSIAAGATGIAGELWL
jgi:hypothetical protein